MLQDTSRWLRMPIATLATAGLFALATVSQAAELQVGGATITITPDKPVALSGQFRTRISTEVESPVTATALALESREGEKSLDQAILVSCDLVSIRDGILEAVREKVAPRLPGFDIQKLVLSATHTHTAPVMLEGRYELPESGIIRPAEYFDFLVNQLASVIEQAWKSRRPGSVGWGLGHAVVAQNRRALYAGGTAQMYGKTFRSDFQGLEGYEDHGVEVLFFWDAEGKLLATAVNVACPSQEVEGLSVVNADFWHQVREQLRKKYGDSLLILGWTGAAGDQSPHLMFRKNAEERMRKLRGLTRLDELARRIVAAVEEAYAGAEKERHPDAVLVHKVKQLQLPEREVTPAELADAREQVAKLSKDPKMERRMKWNHAVIERHERQQKSPQLHDMELHVLRLGDVAIATNSFELFTDYGIQMKARSRALQTFVIQLAGTGSYLPTARAVHGGSYSAIIQSNIVGPLGGQMLVDETVELINSLWPE